MNRLKPTDDNESSTMGVDCIRVEAGNGDAGLLKVLAQIAARITGGPTTDAGKSVKAALCALGQIADKDHETFEHAVMFLVVQSTAYMDDAELVDSGLALNMPPELARMRDKFKEQILEERKAKAEAELKNKQAQ